MEEAEELDHRVADDGMMEAVPGRAPTTLPHAKQATSRPLWALPAALMGGSA